MCLLVSHQVALEGELQATFALDRLTTQLLVVSHVNLNVELLPALATSEGLLPFRVLSAKVAPEFIESHECLLAFGAPGGDFLVMASFQRASQRRQRASLACGASITVMGLVVHLHGLRVLEGFVAPFVLAFERAPVLNQVHGDHRCFDVLGL